MRCIAFALAVLAAGCGQTSTPPPPLPQIDQVVAPPWFICDAIDAPVLLVFERDATTVLVAQYDKPNGAIVQRSEYRVGAEEGAAGSIIITLLQNGAEAGMVRQLNPGMLETPATAYTRPFSSVRIGEREISCRWLPRTRLFGFTGRRSFVVHEDGDGDLIYTTYDFAAAAQAQPIDLSENGRTTTFSVEVRGGEEATSPEGTSYAFSNDGFRYIVSTARNGEGRLEVWREQEPQAPIQSEPLLAFQIGQAIE